MYIIFLKFDEDLLVICLNVKTKQKIVYIAFLSIDFLQIANRLLVAYVIKLSAIASRVLS